MVEALVKRLWYTNPLWFIGAALVLQAVILPAANTDTTFLALAGSMVFVMGMAYMQNWSYAISSRSAMRNSNVLHLGAALFGSATFFITFRYLLLRDMPMALFTAYLFATVLGSIHGQTVSMFIEKRLGLDIIGDALTKAVGAKEVKQEKGAPDDQFFRFWPSVVVLLLAFVGEIVYLGGISALTVVTVVSAAALVYAGLRAIRAYIDGTGYAGMVLGAVVSGAVLLSTGYRLYGEQPNTALLVAVLLLSMPDSFLHAVLRVARSTDHYWFHLTASLMKMGFGFAQLMIVYDMGFAWSLFLPMATGGMLGSLTGSTFAADFARRIKAGFDTHIHEGRDVGWPRTQMVLLLGAGLAVQLAVFGLYQWRGLLVLAGLAFMQTMSFTLISRARQRRDKQYHAWASVGSNGIWYLTMQQLALGHIMPFQAAAYVVGNTSGSLIGQGTALKIEALAGADMVEKDRPKPGPSEAKATA